MCGILGKLKYSLPRSLLLLVYNSLLLPYLIYGALIWSNCSLNKLSKILVIQNRSVSHICFKHYRFHADHLFRELGLLKMHDICTLQMCEFMFKFNSSLLPVNFNNLFRKIILFIIMIHGKQMITIVFTPELEYTRLLLHSGGHLNGKNCSQMSNCVEVCIYSGVKLNGHCCRHIVLVCRLNSLCT